MYRISRPIDALWFFHQKFQKKNNNECILILVIYWKKTGWLHTKISNHNIIYSSQKPRKLSSLPLKSSSRLFSFDVFKFGNNTYPRRIKRRSNLGHIFRGEKVHLMGREIWYLCGNRLDYSIPLFLKSAFGRDQESVPFTMFP